MSDFVRASGGTAIPLCSATAPDLFTVGCQLPAGHDGLHRNNQTLWQWPQIVTVGGETPDLDVETDHWRNREVRLTPQEPRL